MTRDKKPYAQLNESELAEELAVARQHYAAFQAQGLKLNMARGKPAPEQLELSLPLLDVLPAEASDAPLKAGTANDLRNYGGLEGVPAARELMGTLMNVPAQCVLVGGNSSLTLMYNLISLSVTHGVLGGVPWSRLESPAKFLCPVPGYDRHFAITEFFGIEMLPVPLGSEGPDMHMVEELVASDPLVKGIWCVPRFSNPSGAVYSASCVERFAALRPAAPDFRIYWDNAYVVHGFGGEDEPQLASLPAACEVAGNPDLWYQFCSTSKITFAGGGIAALATSPKNLANLLASWGIQSIGSDKINQERHVQFLPTLDAVRAHMARHAALIVPKFEVVLRVLDTELAPYGVGSWTRPSGGYFISFDGLAGTAKRTVALAAQAGVVLTGAGASWPYGKDPLDANIRLAPTYPSLEELELAAQVFVACVKIASLERLAEHAS